MSELETKLALSPQPSTTRVQHHPTTPEKCPPPNLAKRMQDDTCFRCHHKGHWSRFCPLKSKSPNSETLFSPSSACNDSPHPIRCRCGHGFCEIRTSRSVKNPNRKYYACPIKRGAKCREFVKWCDDGMNESDLQPPPFKYPDCECGAGVCRRVKEEHNSDSDKYYFVCPVKQGHGSCGYRVWENELLNSGSGSIVPIRQSRQRTLHDFSEGGGENDRTDNDLALGDGDCLLAHTKRMIIMESSENPSNLVVSEILEQGVGGAVRAATSECVGFPEFEVADDDLEFTNSVSWETIEAQAFLLARMSVLSKLQWPQKPKHEILTDLETLDPCEHESMREAAESTFGLLNVLGVDYKQFSDHVLDYINFVSSIAEIDKSMENSLTMEEHNKLFEEEKMRFAQLQEDYDKTKALLEASNHHKLLLYEQISDLKAILHEKQEQLKSCEMEIMKVESYLGDLKRSMVVADITLKERGEQTEVAKKLNEERQAKQMVAKAALEKAKLITEN